MSQCPLACLAAAANQNRQPAALQSTTTGRPGELAFVSDEELKSFVDGTPDHNVKFPEENFVNGRKLLVALKYNESEKVLKESLADAVKSSAGETKLGQYCVRLNNVLYYEAAKIYGKGDGPKPKYTEKYQESLKYGILASRIFYKQPPAQDQWLPGFST